MKRTNISGRIPGEAPGYIYTGEPETESETGDDSGQLTLTVVFNNVAGDELLRTAWGFALWIEDKEGAVLFDSGSDGDILLDNITSAGLDLTRLHTIVVSHEHWDHVNGLPVIMSKLRRQVPVFVPAEIENKIRDMIPGSDIIPVTGPQCITGEIWTTGPLEGSHKGRHLPEQAIVISKDGKSIIITGCSHPGIDEVVAFAGNHFPENSIELVAGGFHMEEFTGGDIKDTIQKLKNLNVLRVAPSHCTGSEAMKYFSDAWNENYVHLRLGENFITG